MNMNTIQLDALRHLERTIGRSVKSIVEGQDCVFIEMEGITVTIGLKGAYGIPSVRTYDGGPKTPAQAYSLWNKQKRRDSHDLTKARGYITGHLNPIVGSDWICLGDIPCPCRDEIDPNRRRHRSFRKS